MNIAEFRAIRKKAGVCRDCGKEDAYTMGGRTLCADCAEKSAKAKREARKDPEKRLRQYESHRKMTEQRKRDGRCPLCGRPVTGEHIHCNVCNAKNRNYLRQRRHERGQMSWGDRTNGSRCFLCGEPCVEGKKLCEKHMIQRIENLRKSNPDSVYLPTERYLQPNAR